MTTVPIEDVEKEEIVGSVSDSEINYKDDEFEDVVKSEVLNSDGTANILVAGNEPESGTLNDEWIVVEPGEDGFAMAVVESLPYPYLLYLAEQKSELSRPTY